MRGDNPQDKLDIRQSNILYSYQYYAVILFLTPDKRSGVQEIENHDWD